MTTNINDTPETLHTVALRMVDTLDSLGIIPEITDTLRRAIREPMVPPAPTDGVEEVKEVPLLPDLQVPPAGAAGLPAS